LTQYQPPERLVALYPKEGTFWHEHPMGIVNADWTTAEQRDAARVFVDYVLTPTAQTLIMTEGFRPANPDVELAFPFVPENGIDPNQPRTILDVPAPDVIATIQQSWAFVKKQADILVLIDTSGSMSNENKMDQAIEAALAFLDNMEPTNRVGLATFDSEVEMRLPLENFETAENQLRSHIRSLRADGGTALFTAVAETAAMMSGGEDDDRIRAIVLLSDGADTESQGVTLSDAVTALEASRNELNPLILIPVAYGSDADINALNALARASNTRVQSGDAQSILAVLAIISSYF
jgi:Ca-activated chloride channel family protein